MYRRWYPQESILTPFCNRLATACAVVLAASILASCGGGGGGTGPASAPDAPITGFNNTAPLSVDSGPTGLEVNRLYTTVTVCMPGNSAQCTTLDHILVDTGSVGLRVLASELTVPLPRSTASSGQTLVNCVQFVDNSYAWGPVATADVRWGGKVAANIPMQIIADPAVRAPGSVCATGATPIVDVTTVGVRGILGVGLFKEDCGASCASVAGNGFYFSCTGAACGSVVAARVPLSQQVKHPVPFFGPDNNGIVIDLPAADADGAIRVDGTITFGIGTQSNNRSDAARVLTTNTAGNIQAAFAGRTLNNSFIDSGSNGNYFDGGGLPLCARSKDFYCPVVPTTLATTLTGTNGTSINVPFRVSDSLQTSAAVRPGLAGPVGDARIFDFGLPFFLGRRVWVGIENSASPLGTGPYYAF